MPTPLGQELHSECAAIRIILWFQGKIRRQLSRRIACFVVYEKWCGRKLQEDDVEQRDETESSANRQPDVQRRLQDDARVPAAAASQMSQHGRQVATWTEYCASYFSLKIHWLTAGSKVRANALSSLHHFRHVEFSALTWHVMPRNLCFQHE